MVVLDAWSVRTVKSVIFASVGAQFDRLDLCGVSSGLVGLISYGNAVASTPCSVLEGLRRSR
jgi:hypothetical protein